MEGFKYRDLIAKAGFVGGIIPNEDVPKSKEMGVKAVLGPGPSLRRLLIASSNA